MKEEIKIKPVNRGKRPFFFDDPAIDQLIAIIMAMSGELSVLYDRVDTIERLLETNGGLKREDIEKFKPNQEIEGERNVRRNEYISRLFKIITDEKTNLTPHNEMKDYRNLMKDLDKT
tara:strand:- start:38 stop:391 length:354 start_codon:yes stop_codon:yes gene_type:complete